MTHDEAARLVAVMLVAIPSHRVQPTAVPAMIDAYADLLADLSYEHCNAALRALLHTSTWLPSVADIRKVALELVRGPVRAGGEAWGDVLKAIAGAGAYRTPGVDFHFKDPVVARAVDALNWQVLCLSENPTAERARFVDLYDALAVQHRREDLSPVLATAKEQRLIDSANDIVEQLAKRLSGDKP